MADDLRRHPEEPPAAATLAAHGAVDRGAVSPGRAEPDWSTLPLPADAPRHWTDAVAAAPEGSRERAHAERVREVELLAAAVAGPELGAWLDRLDPDALTSAGVVEAVAAAARVEAAAHARTARLAAALAARPEMEPSWDTAPGPAPAQRSVAGDELAFRLGSSRWTTNGLVREGLAFEGHLHATGAALADGRIDARKARVLVDRLWDLPPQLTALVEDRVLPTAPERPVSRLRRDVEEALLAVDPADAVERHEHARTRRHVTRPRVEPDGMASLRLLLPAEDATRVDGVLDHAARAARACGDPRTLDQLRADGLRDLVVGTDEEAGPGFAWEVGTLTARLGDRTAHGTTLRPVEPLVLGAGPAADAAWTTESPATPAPERRPDVRPDESPEPAGPAPVRRTGRRPGAQVRLTVAASTVLGLDDRPAELDGYGPVDAVTARALAVGGDWRRIVTDPASGAVLDVGRAHYRPPVPLAEHVRARDRHCAAPGCTVPASRADLDHTRPFHADPRSSSAPCGNGPDAGRDDPPGDPGTAHLGVTAAHNLGPLCRRHHRLKTEAGYALRQLRPGVFEWLTPTGHRYLVRPGTDQVVDLTTVPADLPPPF